MILSRIGYYGPRLIYSERVGDPGNLLPVKELAVPRPKMSNEQIRKLVRRRPWKKVAGTWLKQVPMGTDSDCFFELTITPLAPDNSERCKIEINPDAVIPDVAASLVIGAEFMAVEAAKTACDEIAIRILLREFEAA